ncbi:MAG TPA: hypothetical protein VHK24_02195 [Steroidobacter sp.]|nr:hypothetical protein [Steroidobacter sp.]
MKVLDPEDRVDYDPYNTAAFRVKAKRPPRRSLDDMRKLDEEIRERRTTAKSGE